MSFAQNAVDNKVFVSLNLVVITSNGTYTPPNNLLYAQVIAVGGGGGSGGRAATTAAGASHAFGGGGGGGGTCIKSFNLSDLLPNVSVTIGSGGAAGSAGLNSGGNGGDTIFATSTPLQAGGGAGGGSASSASDEFGLDIIGALGGSASGGDLNTGNAGAPGASLLCAPAGSGRRNGDTARAGNLYGGGAGTCWNTSSYGLCSQSARAGAVGAQGVVIIYEYLGVAP